MRALAFLGRHAALILAAGVLLGLALPDVAHLLRPMLTPTVFVLMLLAMLRIRWDGLAALARRPVTAVLVLAWMLVLSPVAMWLLVSQFEMSPGLAAALVLMAGAPPLMSSPAFSVLIGLDGALSLVVLVVATLAAPVVLPAVALEGLGLALAMDGIGLALRLGGLVGAALAGALILRRAIGLARLERHAARIDGVSVLLLLLFAVAIMDGVAERLAQETAHVLAMTAIAFAANLGLQAVGALAAAPLGLRSALTVGFSSGNRNMALLLAVLPAGADPDMQLYFAVGQFPIYMLPALLAPLYMRVLRARPASEPPPPV